MQWNLKKAIQQNLINNFTMQALLHVSKRNLELDSMVTCSIRRTLIFIKHVYFLTAMLQWKHVIISDHWFILPCFIISWLLLLLLLVLLMFPYKNKWNEKSFVYFIKLVNPIKHSYVFVMYVQLTVKDTLLSQTSRDFIDNVTVLIMSDLPSHIDRVVFNTYCIAYKLYESFKKATGLRNLPRCRHTGDCAVYRHGMRNAVQEAGINRYCGV